MDETENLFLVTLRLPVKNSPIILMIVITLHIICLFIPWLTELALYIKILLIGMVISSCYVFLYKRYLYNSDSQHVETLVLNYDDNWQVKMSDGTSYHAELGHSLFVHPWLTIISLFFENRREYFIFTPEIINADLFRRLRVRLRFKIGEQ